MRIVKNIVSLSFTLGVHCDLVNECQKNKSFCVNGECRVYINGSAHCDCNTGYNGTFCENDIDECLLAKNPCNEKFGNCVNTQGSYRCNCKPGYTGMCH